jgi:hypothetical protein
MAITFKIDKLPEALKKLFVADGNKRYPGKERSPWFDKEEEDRSYRDVSQNIWMNPSGAANQFFDPVVIEKIRGTTIKAPKYTGTLKFDYTNSSVFGPRISNVTLVSNPRGNFRWWGELEEIKNVLRPNQLHNYIIGSDISFGTGASNSTAMIVDRNTGELIGELVTPDMRVDEFADVVSALYFWIGGANAPFVIWERTGGHGINFGRRIMENGVTNVYTKTTETGKTRKRQQVYGWDNTGGPNGTKGDLLERLEIALKEGLKDKHERAYLIIHSEEVTNEMDGYIFYSSGELDSSESIDQSSGARKRHGDRIIGVGLCVLGMLDQPVSDETLVREPPYGSLAWGMLQSKIEDEKLKTGQWQDPPNMSTRWS